MRRLLLLAVAITSFSASAEQFGDPELGQMKAPSCVFCHGRNGEATNPAYPNLKGQNAQYLYQSMKAYKNGERPGAYGEMMKGQLKNLNDEDLRDVASFFASQ
ncbi:c-type cytochrome [Vibrio sp.]|uniref:c-type cytochrome n=1 Tax=Vibrio sp. TaxID=678 RepID=UPI003D0FE728